LDRQVDVPFDPAIDRLEVVAHRRLSVEGDLDGAVDSFELRLLELPAERDAHGSVDRVGSDGPADLGQVDRPIDDVAGNGTVEAAPLHLPVGRLQPHRRARGKVNFVVHARIVPAEIEKTEEVMAVGVDRLQPYLVAHLSTSHLRLPESLLAPPA